MFTWKAIIQDELSYILVSYKAKEAIKSSSFMRMNFSWNHTIYAQYAIIIWAYIKTLTEDLYNTFIVIYVSHTWQSNMVISLQKVNYISFTRRCICIDFAGQITCPFIVLKFIMADRIRFTVCTNIWSIKQTKCNILLFSV